MKSKTTAYALLGLLIPAIIAGAYAQEVESAQNGAALAKVNGVTVPADRLELLVKAQTAQGQKDSPEMRNRIREALITNEMLVQEATKKGLDKAPETLTQLQLNRMEILANAYVQDYVKRNPVSEDAIKKEYERVRGQVGEKEYKAHHILLKSEDEAKQVIAEIKKGGNFEKVAAAKSEDSSKSNGGDLGWNGPERYVPAFGDALKKLKKGQMTETPVQTQFGWHVIRLDDERVRKFPTLEEVRPQVVQQLQTQQVNKMISDLRAKTKIE